MQSGLYQLRTVDRKNTHAERDRERWPGIASQGCQDPDLLEFMGRDLRGACGHRDLMKAFVPPPSFPFRGKTKKAKGRVKYNQRSFQCNISVSKFLKYIFRFLNLFQTITQLPISKSIFRSIIDLSCGVIQISKLSRCYF